MSPHSHWLKAAYKWKTCNFAGISVLPPYYILNCTSKEHVGCICFAYYIAWPQEGRSCVAKSVFHFQKKTWTSTLFLWANPWSSFLYGNWVMSAVIKTVRYIATSVNASAFHELLLCSKGIVRMTIIIRKSCSDRRGACVLVLVLISLDAIWNWKEKLAVGVARISAEAMRENSRLQLSFWTLSYAIHCEYYGMWLWEWIYKLLCRYITSQNAYSLWSPIQNWWRDDSGCLPEKPISTIDQREFSLDPNWHRYNALNVRLFAVWCYIKLEVDHSK